MGRHRNTTVCTFCRRRKIRCDKGKPCSSCVKYRNQNCEYSEKVLGPSGLKTKKTLNIDDLEQDKLMEELRRITARISELEKGYGSNQGYGGSSGSDVSPSSVAQTIGLTPERPSSKNTSPIGSMNVTSAFDLNGDHDTMEEDETDDDDDDDNEDRICFTEEYDALYDNEPVYRRYHGPFSWYSSMKLDPVLNNLWRFVQLNFAKGKQWSFPSRTPDTIENLETNQYFNKKLREHDGLDNVKSVGKNCTLGQPMALRLNSLAMGKSDSISPGDLTNTILAILPTRKAIWLLIDHFFNEVYGFICVVDEEYLRKKTIKLLGPENYEDTRVETINVEKKLDFIHLGILLLVLKLSYNSLLCNIEKVNQDNINTTDTSKKAQDLKYMLTHPMNMGAISVVELCFNQFNLLSTVNISILQLGVLILFYRLYGPELGEGTDNSESLTLNSLLMQVAYSAGCHREPTKLNLTKRNPKLDNICRKLWFNLLLLDNLTSMANGDPSNSIKYSFDVLPAFLNEDCSNANCRNLEIERIMINGLSDIKDRYRISQGWLRKLQVLDKPIKIKELDSMTSRVFDFVDSHLMFRTIFDDITTTSKYFIKTFKLKFFFQASFFAITVYFHISIYYSKRYNFEKSFSYGFEGLELLMKQLLPIFTELLTNTSRKLNSVADWVLNPVLQTIMNRALIINLSFLLRMRLYLVKKPEMSEQMRAKVQKCGDLLTKSSEVFLTFMSGMSNRYYYAWRTTKIQGYLLSCCNSSELGNLYNNYPFVADFGVTEPRVDKLNELLEESLTQLEITESLNLFNDLLKVNTEDSDNIWLQVLALRRIQRDKERSTTFNPNGKINPSASVNTTYDFPTPFGDSPEIFPLGSSNDGASTNETTTATKEVPEFAFDLLFGFDAIDEIFEDSIGSRSTF